MPRNETTGPGGLPWLRNFKFPSKSHPDGPRSQTLEPELAAGLYETNLLEVSATLRPSVSPPHVASVKQVVVALQLNRFLLVNSSS